MGQNQTGMGALIEAAGKFREQERTLHLQLEERIAQLLQWAHASPVDTDDPAGELASVAESLRVNVTPIIERLREIRKEPALVPIAPVVLMERLEEGPIDAVREHIFSVDAADPEAVLEGIAEAFRIYHEATTR